MKSSFTAISLLLLDVDGILTTGSVIYSDSGEEIKVFNVRDGLGLRMLMDAGIRVGIVTGRAAPALRHRLKNLNIELIWDGVRDKAALLPEIKEKTGILPKAMAFMGDDLPDMGLMRRVGVSITVCDAVSEVREMADFTTKACGGRGAVREVCEAILKEKDLWPTIVERFQE
ncbi:3-deoxy-D-manno-octulosonate 8-phosphate phosphatase (KDO 8-P phosphatase) [Desulfobotulus alkaliphilus]|uniref:3-deoxy-D-manno-octulosonate 8-phosphate phosphatase (KDO 8-P phosphatase) n=1 Tax=Desulfobotulus alkaliphilus TaxID=622671 RepID=A0A562S7Z0_9BACT|nr:HAD-IIIA family hydrolase [Desulfobotulus alkaliphilus]TWI77293.1 3-deoxy-D-manno-octulosonate 8-phosphate phosphatase (KDO 8-P phosphatase) [Desulfobotulus alkaliphilus]